MGLGIGIVLGASMLQLIELARSQERALAAGEGARTYTQEQLDAAVAQAVEAAQRLPSPTASPDPSAEASSSPPESSDSGVGKSEPTYAFYVYKGMDLKTVARSLLDLGLIDDTASFIQHARPYSRKLEVGTATFAAHPTYEEIVAELTRHKD